MWVMHLHKLVVTKRVLLNGGLKIQDGCQSWPLIAAKKLFLLHQLFWKKSYGHKCDNTKSLVFMTNDDVDADTIYKLSVVENG